MSRAYVYKCNQCNKILSYPDKPKDSIEHLNVKGVQLFLSYYSKTHKQWQQEKFPFPCKEYHFCNGKCLGLFVDANVGAVTERIKPFKEGR